ncbi:hypothetical protein CUMW_257780 [Citrus unshiu]|uniref:Uncharacterized protein n=1 Tax=Citrus unshiu TaxID=55188 RepID=A0A2H5QTI6_CITUN|nr:hypothetical protein CUMW_257780 [Citrus unshiu]
MEALWVENPADLTDHGDALREKSRLRVAISSYFSVVTKIRGCSPVLLDLIFGSYKVDLRDFWVAKALWISVVLAAID